MNKVVLLGRLGKDAEVKKFENGVKCTFTLATSERWTDKVTGEKKESTEWHNIAVWGKLAEICGKYCKKGDNVLVEGKLKTHQWEDNGVKKSMVTVEASQVEFLTPKNVEKKDIPEVPAFDEAGAMNDDGLPF